MDMVPILNTIFAGCTIHLDPQKIKPKSIPAPITRKSFHLLSPATGVMERA